MCYIVSYEKEIYMSEEKEKALDISRVLKDGVQKPTDEKEIFNRYKEQKKLREYNKQDLSTCDKTFIIQNTKTGRIIEIKAHSIVLAAKAAGWRPRHTVLLEEKITVYKQEKQGEVK